LEEADAIQQGLTVPGNRGRPMSEDAKMEGKSREQLVEEIGQLRSELEALGQVEAERKRMEERAKHLNLVLRAIRQVNQIIIREKSRDRLLQDACNTLTGSRGYYNAWTALLGEDNRLVTCAESGLGKGFLPLVELLKRGELPRCGRKALGRAGVVVTQDPVSACADCPLSQKYGGRGAMTARLEHGGKVYGLMAASIPIEFARDPEEQTLLDEVAADIASALYNIKLEEQRKQAEQEARYQREYFQSLFEGSPEAVVSIDAERQVMDANPAFERLFGYAVEDIRETCPG